MEKRTQLLNQLLELKLKINNCNFKCNIILNDMLYDKDRILNNENIPKDIKETYLKNLIRLSELINTLD